MADEKRERMTDDTDANRLEIRNGEKFTVKDVTHQPIWIRWTLYILAIAIILMGLFIVGKIMPYEPMTITDVAIEPPESCGGEEITVTYTLKVDGGLYTIDNLHGFAYWLSDEDTRPYSSIYFTIDDVDPFEETSAEGPTRRVAPWPEDYWHAGVDATIYGKRFGFVPVEQRLHVESEDTLYTYGRFAERCVSGGDNNN